MLHIVIKTREGIVEFRKEGILVEQLSLLPVAPGDEIHIRLSKESAEAYIVDNGDLEGVSAD